MLANFLTDEASGNRYNRAATCSSATFGSKVPTSPTPWNRSRWPSNRTTFCWTPTLTRRCASVSRNPLRKRSLFSCFGIRAMCKLEERLNLLIEFWDCTHRKHYPRKLNLPWELPCGESWGYLNCASRLETSNRRCKFQRLKVLSDALTLIFRWWSPCCWKQCPWATSGTDTFVLKNWQETNQPTSQLVS